MIAALAGISTTELPPRPPPQDQLRATCPRLQKQTIRAVDIKIGSEDNRISVRNLLPFNNKSALDYADVEVPSTFGVNSPSYHTAPRLGLGFNSGLLSPKERIEAQLVEQQKLAKRLRNTERRSMKELSSRPSHVLGVGKMPFGDSDETPPAASRGVGWDDPAPAPEVESVGPPPGLPEMSLLSSRMPQLPNIKQQSLALQRYVAGQPAPLPVLPLTSRLVPSTMKQQHATPRSSTTTLAEPSATSAATFAQTELLKEGMPVSARASLGNLLVFCRPPTRQPAGAPPSIGRNMLLSRPSAYAVPPLKIVVSQPSSPFFTAAV